METENQGGGPTNLGLPEKWPLKRCVCVCECVWLGNRKGTWPIRCPGPTNAKSLLLGIGKVGQQTEGERTVV